MMVMMLKYLRKRLHSLPACPYAAARTIKRFIRSFCIVISFFLVSCVDSTHLDSLTVTDQPGEILETFTLTDNGDFFEEKSDPPNIIPITALKTKIQYLSGQYEHSPGGWGPVLLRINTNNIPHNLSRAVKKWDELCLCYSVPYIILLVNNNDSKFLKSELIKSEQLAVKDSSIIKINIYQEKIQLLFPYGGNQHAEEIFHTPQDMLSFVKSRRYMKEYRYKIFLRAPNESKQWRFLFDILKFFNEQNLRYQLLF